MVCFCKIDHKNKQKTNKKIKKKLLEKVYLHSEVQFQMLSYLHLFETTFLKLNKLFIQKAQLTVITLGQSYLITITQT
jgi:hypothetical protein